MKLFDWIKGLFNKNKTLAIEAPKENPTLSPEKQFRAEIAEEGQLSEAEKLKIEQEIHRKGEIRIAYHNILQSRNNLDNDSIKKAIENVTGTKTSLTELDVETLKHIHYVTQNNPDVSQYLGQINPKTKDNNILSVVDRMQEKAKTQAKINGYREDFAQDFMPNAGSIISELQEEQRQSLQGEREN